jgi:hypothetical protein
MDFRNDGELFAKNFGVVANVNGQRVFNEDEFVDLGRMRITQCGLSQLGLELNDVLPCLSAELRPGFEKNDRLLMAARTGADEGGAVDPGMLVENGFAGDGEERAAFGDDAVGLAAAEPKTGSRKSR